MNDVLSCRGEKPRWNLIITCLKEDDRLAALHKGLERLCELRGVHNLDGLFAFYDDEADQGTPNIKVSRRKVDGEIKRSKLNQLIVNVKKTLGTNLFIPVTPNPQSLVVQDSEILPTQAVLLSQGNK